MTSTGLRGQERSALKGRTDPSFGEKRESREEGVSDQLTEGAFLSTHLTADAKKPENGYLVISMKEKARFV